MAIPKLDVMLRMPKEVYEAITEAAKQATDGNRTRYILEAVRARLEAEGREWPGKKA